MWNIINISECERSEIDIVSSSLRLELPSTKTINGVEDV